MLRTLLALCAFATSAATLGAPPVDLSAVPPERHAARFALCDRGPRINCVVDGDTVWYAGEKIRIADINAPETHGPQGAYEAALGAAATMRLTALLNAGPFGVALSTAPIDRGRDHDRYGRLLRVVTRRGASLGTVLVREGLAEPWTGHRRNWC